MSSSLFLVVLLLIRLASTAAIFQPAQNVSDLLSASVCVPSRDWIDTGYVASDCQEAIRRFIHEEVFVQMDQELEFLAPGVDPFHTLPTVLTPRRYTVGGSYQIPVLISGAISAHIDRIQRAAAS